MGITADSGNADSLKIAGHLLCSRLAASLLDHRKVVRHLVDAPVGGSAECVDDHVLRPDV